MESKIGSRNWSEFNTKQREGAEATHKHFAANSKHPEPTLFCAVCKEPCFKRCPACPTCYCSKEHQSLDWERHKNSLEHRGVYGDPDAVHVSTLQTDDFNALYPNITPSIIQKRREKAARKQKETEHSQKMMTALKIMANAEYGFQGATVIN